MSSVDLSELRIERRDPTPRDPNRTRMVRILAAVALGLAAVSSVALFALRPRAIAVQVARAELRGGAAGGLTANGYVVARTKASISSKVAGRLTRLAVEEGDQVQAGEVIGWLEAAEYEAAVRQAEADELTMEAARLEAAARLVQARRDLDRARTLERDSLVSPQVVQDAATGVATTEAQLRAAEARVAAARASVAGARATLENTRIRAPFDGTVLRKDAEVGEVVAPAVAGGGLTRGAVVTMADLSTLEVEVDVSESYIAEVREDQPATITLDAYPSGTYPGHVRQIVPTADRQKATVLVRVAIDSADPRILPEMGARVAFTPQEQPGGPAGQAVRRPAGIFVPAAAVQRDGDADVVWIVNDGQVSRREVEAGPVSGDVREVREGLRGGELLVLDPPAELTEGAQVRVVESSSSDGAGSD